MPLIAAAAMIASPPVGQAVCRTLVVAKRAGETITVADTRDVPCRPMLGQDLPALGYDRGASAVVARTAMVAGTFLGRAYIPAAAQVRAGDRVIYSVTTGHVTVARAVVALQSAFAGQSFWARAADGTLVVVPGVAP